jgi:hypothetical protein
LGYGGVAIHRWQVEKRFFTIKEIAVYLALSLLSILMKQGQI